jgi:predicted dehydrogenase
MRYNNRRDFLKKSFLATGGMLVSGSAFSSPVILDKKSPNDRINVAVIGLNGKGRHHYTRFCQIPNTRVTTICDVDERLFPGAINDIEKLSGFKPRTEVDIRSVLDDKDIDAISIATPDHWHALMSVWACQAGKDVYVEKPVSYTIEEGRKMVEAARKYGRIVQGGMNMRAEPSVRAAMKFLHDGKLGNIYMAKGVCFKPRDSIGFVKDSKVPEGVHWDLFLGPAPERPFNQNRFHYNWHYFWDYSTTEMGNIVHQMDLARWGINKHEHPVKVHSAGGMFVWDSDQEVPNTQHVLFEYSDGKILQYEVRGVYTNQEGDVSVGNLFYGDEGWMTSAGGWKTFYGGTEDLSAPDYTPGFPKRFEKPGPVIRQTDLSEYPKQDHYENFINCIRSRRREDLYADIIEGHRSATLSHLANISFRTGRKLIFNPETETFNDDVEANSYLTRQYRYPYIMPKEV